MGVPNPDRPRPLLKLRLAFPRSCVSLNKKDRSISV